MLRLALVSLCAAAAFAQNPGNPSEKPPADLEKALVERITEFYQYHVTGEFRKAEALVAEDTKDLYYSQNKPKYLGFEIGRIVYKDNFTRASATVFCKQTVMFPGFAGQPMNVPTPSTWKLVDGKWYWYIDPEVLKRFPFGKATGSEQAAQGLPPAPTGTPAGPAMPDLSTMPTTPDFIMNKLKADRQEIELKAREAESVTLTNTATGTMSFAVKQPLAGLEVTPERASLKAGESVTLTLRAMPNMKPSGEVHLLIQPTQEDLAIKVASK
jgi:hypothetical protein